MFTSGDGCEDGATTDYGSRHKCQSCQCNIDEALNMEHSHIA
jgi:hypothetical protein